jgi:hypothetical protein
MKIENKINPFNLFLQMENYLKEFVIQENTNFIAGTNINLRAIYFHIRILIISKIISHIKF